MAQLENDGRLDLSANGKAFKALHTLGLNDVICAKHHLDLDTNVVRVCHITVIDSTSATPTQTLQHSETGEKNVQDEFVIRVVHQKKPLGQGAFGKVYHGILSHKKADDRSVCIKQADLHADPDFDSLANEHRTYSLLRGKSHVNFLQSHGMFVHGAMGFLIIDYFEGKSLHRIMVSDDDVMFSYYKVLDIMTQLMTALTYLHEKEIIHLDVKPDNILYLDQRHGSVLKLIDFGLSCKFKNRDTVLKLRPRGTFLFMAPELHIRELAGPKTDVFAAGLTAYSLITAKQPWSMISDAKDKKFIVLNKMREGTQVGIDWSHLPTDNIWREVIAIIDVMCRYNYEDRPFSEEVLDRLLKLPIPEDEQEFNPTQPEDQPLDVPQDELPLVSALSSGHTDDPDSYCELLPEVADDFRDSEIVSAK